MSTRLLIGDCRLTLPTLEAGSVQTCITSVPYFQLRSYLAATDQFKPLEIGLEKTPELWLAHLSHVFHEVWRVLRHDGTLWVNCGDSYAGSGNGAHDYRDRATSTSLSLNPDKYQGQKPLQRVGPQEHTEGHGRVAGYRPKNLMMMPSRLAMALQADGWILRSMIPWVKRSAMPESVTDRPSTAVEYVFLLSKRPRYYWDADAVRRTTQPDPRDARWGSTNGTLHEHLADGEQGQQQPKAPGWVRMSNPGGRNIRNSDWFMDSLMLDDQDDPLALVVNPAGFAGAHFAVFPPKLVEPMVKASTRPGDIVLDPFAGSGTTLMVADRLGRNGVGCELSSSYSGMATERLVGDAPMFSEVSVA